MSWLTLLASSFSFGQEPGTIPTEDSSSQILIKEHSPHRASMYSALVPGLGQTYNKKYWKLPIIYGLTGVLIYSFEYNNSQYIKYKNAYADMLSGEISTFEVYSSTEILENIKDNYLRNRDLNVITLAFVYILNILDASVDAHLYDYSVSKDLSLNIHPTVIRNHHSENSIGISLSLKF